MPPWLDSGRSRSVELDLRGARALHRAVSRPGVLRLLAFCSRVADGPLWFSLILLWPLLDADVGWLGSRLVLAIGAVNLLLYWGLKRSTRRLRPFDRCDDIRACVKVPDPFSFPSGHTLHATAFALLLSSFYPALGPLLWPFAALVGVSRVVLGLHFPSDVLVGALLGAGTASTMLLVAT